MSVQLIAWAYEQRVGSWTEKAVLLALANASNHHTGRCHPRIATIAFETELNEKTVRRALVKLTDKGYVDRVRSRKEDGKYGLYHYKFPHLKLDSDDAPPDTESAGTTGHRVRSEPEVNLEPEVVLAATPRTKARNAIWDALTEVFGDATTETARSRRGKVCRSLAGAGASPGEIVRRAKSWPRHFDDATLTELALEKHWDTLAHKPLRMNS